MAAKRFFDPMPPTVPSAPRIETEGSLGFETPGYNHRQSRLKQAPTRDEQTHVECGRLDAALPLD